MNNININELISVIIPVYNVRKYLDKCLNSVINQSYSNLEIIIVDDGSDDGSEDICDNYKKKDERIIVVHQENKGLSAARNTGIECSSGEWIYFLDSDDWIDSELIKRLYEIAKKYNAQISSCGSYDIAKNGKFVVNGNNDGKISIFENDEIIEGLQDPRKPIRFEVWNKLWNSNLIGNTRFKEGQVSEEIYFDRKLFSKTNKIVFIDKCLHHYLLNREGNTMSSFKTKRLLIFEEFKEWICDLETKGEIKSAITISNIACNYAAGLYYEATKDGQNIEVKNELSEYFDYFYKLAKKKNMNSLKIKLFKISKKMYCVVSDCYHILINSVF